MILNQGILFVSQYIEALFSTIKIYFLVAIRENRHSAGQQAGRWFARRLSDVSTGCDQEKFKLWLSADRESSIHYYQLEEIWVLLARYSDKPEIQSARTKICQSLE